MIICTKQRETQCIQVFFVFACVGMENEQKWSHSWKKKSRVTHEWETIDVNRRSAERTWLNFGVLFCSHHYVLGGSVPSFAVSLRCISSVPSISAFCVEWRKIASMSESARRVDCECLCRQLIPSSITKQILCRSRVVSPVLTLRCAPSDIFCHSLSPQCWEASQRWLITSGAIYTQYKSQTCISLTI